jgi:hypothetical protein
MPGELTPASLSTTPCARHTACKGQDVTPWYTQYRWAYLRSIGPAPFEQFDVPVACTLASLLAWLTCVRYAAARAYD